MPQRPEVLARPSGWTGGRITALVIGVLLALPSLGLLTGGGAALWTDRTQRDAAGYVNSGVHDFSTSRAALVSRRVDVGSTWVSSLYPANLLGEVRIRVTPVNTGPALFVGIGRTTDVDRYLAGMSHGLISDFWENKVQDIGGGPLASAPGTQSFWVASTTGTGPRTLLWEPANGSWSVVVMNADGRSGIDVRADLGATMPSLLWIAVGLLVAGGVFGIGAALLIAGAIRGAARARTV